MEYPKCIIENLSLTLLDRVWGVGIIDKNTVRCSSRIVTDSGTFHQWIQPIKCSTICLTTSLRLINNPYELLALTEGRIVVALNETSCLFRSVGS